MKHFSLQKALKEVCFGYIVHIYFHSLNSFFPFTCCYCFFFFNLSLEDLDRWVISAKSAVARVEQHGVPIEIQAETVVAIYRWESIPKSRETLGKYSTTGKET